MPFSDNLKPSKVSVKRNSSKGESNLTFFESPEYGDYTLAVLYSRKEKTHHIAYQYLCLAAHLPCEQEDLLLDPIEGSKLISDILANGHDQAVHELAIQHNMRANDETSPESIEKKEKHRLIAFTLCNIVATKFQQKKKPIPQDIQAILDKHLYSEAHIPWAQDHLLLDPIKGPEIIADILTNGSIQAVCEIAILHHEFTNDKHVNAVTELKDKHRRIALLLCDTVVEKCQENSRLIPKEIQNILSQEECLLAVVPTSPKPGI